MGTRSMIAIQNPYSKDVRAVYCHWDGYLEHNGSILNKHYSNSAKVNNLIALGGLSSLRPEIGEAHPFSQFVEETEDFKALPKAKQKQIKAETKAAYEAAVEAGYCTFYARDRGETEQEFRVFPTMAKAQDYFEGSWCEYLYVFKYKKSDDYQSGEWHFKKPGGRWKKLAPALAKLKAEDCA
jgi:hypothetical protein